MFLEILQNSQENACARVSFDFIYNFIKKDTLTQVFSCEFSEISQNAFFYKTPLVHLFNRTPLGDYFWCLSVALSLWTICFYKTSVYLKGKKDIEIN